MNRIIRIKEVLEATGLSRSTLYRYISQGQFPRGVRLNRRLGSNGAVGWPKSVIDEWLNTREASDEL